MARSRTVHRLAAVALTGFCAALSACSTSSTPAVAASTSRAGATVASTGSASPTSVAAIRLPNSCGALNATVAHFIGRVGMSRSLASRAVGVSCEIANANTTSIVIINLGPASAAQLAVLRAASGGGGRTITTVSGQGASAFSVSKNGVVHGFAVLTTQGTLCSVTTGLSLAQDEALCAALTQLT